MLPVIAALAALTLGQTASPASFDVGRATMVLVQDEQTPPPVKKVSDPPKQESSTASDKQDPKDQQKPDPDQEKIQKDEDADIKLGKEYSAEVDKEVQLSDNSEMNARLQSIGNEMAELANETPREALWGDKRFFKFPYSFKLIKGDDVNAFSLPGGPIYVYEGLMKFVESDDELAAVLGHEISHASFRHMATMQRDANKLQLLSIPALIAAALSRDSSAMGALMATQLVSQSMVSGWSVQAETASDYGSLQLLVKSRYNPVAMLTFMERLAFRDQFNANVDWGIYRTHPPSEQRARFIVDYLNTNHIPIKRSAVTKTFSARSLPQPDGTFELWFGKEEIHTFRGTDAKNRAAKAVIKLNDFLDSVPQMIDVSSYGPTVTGKHRDLFTIEPQDLTDGQDPAAAAKDAVVSMKRVVFNLSFHLWPIHDRGLN